jgi:hypothetical protein
MLLDTIRIKEVHMNRRTAIAAIGAAPFIAPAAAAPEGNRAAQFAIASAMAFFHGVMADEHVPLDQRLEAGRGLIDGAIYLETLPIEPSGTTY